MAQDSISVICEPPFGTIIWEGEFGRCELKVPKEVQEMLARWKQAEKIQIGGEGEFTFILKGLGRLVAAYLGYIYTCILAPKIIMEFVAIAEKKGVELGMAQARLIKRYTKE